MGKKKQPLHHILIPLHSILTEEEKKKVLEEFRIGGGNLPRILINDPALNGLEPSIGDVVKIERKDPTGKNYYYRIVVKE